MTVTELREHLQRLEAEGHGSLPVHYLELLGTLYERMDPHVPHVDVRGEFVRI